jgi:hypothetical protein
MSSAWLPEIGPENYPAFLTIPANDFPKTFKEWDRMLSRKSDDLQLQFHPHGGIINVKINPGEFIEHCRTTRPKSTLEALFRFAIKKGGG